MPMCAQPATGVLPVHQAGRTTDMLATDLLNGEETQVDFTFAAPLRVKVRGLNGLMLSLKF